MKRASLWLKRYWQAELAGTAAALLSVVVTQQLGGGHLASALVAPWAENVGYYGTMLVKELRAEARRTGGGVFFVALRALRNISLEFGPAELFDTLLVRPAMMYLFATLSGSAAIGVVLGKIAADVVFYVPVIASFEARRAYEERHPSKPPATAADKNQG